MLHALYGAIKRESGVFAVGCEVQGARGALRYAGCLKIVGNQLAGAAEFLAGDSAQAPGLVLSA